MTAGRKEWLWSWRKVGVVDQGEYSASALDDFDGPNIEEEPWASIRSAIYLRAREIYLLNVTCSSDTIGLTGSVTSEQTKSAIAALFGGRKSLVRNMLEVAAPFEPAGGHPPVRAILADKSSGVTRHPIITPGEAARPGDVFEFTVDLGASAEVATQGAPVTLSSLPQGWMDIQIDVEVFCDTIAFDTEKDRHGNITVFSDGTSRPCIFRGRVLPSVTAGTTFKLMVTFEHSGRHAGSAVRRVPVEQGSNERSPEEAIAPAAIVSGSLRLVQGIPPPILMVKIIAGPVGKWTWSLKPNGSDAPYKTVRWREDIELKDDTLDFARKLLKQCPSLRPGRRHAAVLRGIGENIWAASPTCFKELYSELRGRHGARFPIQIVTDEPHVPWEMMHPDASAGFERPDHLFMTHPMARWFCAVEGGMREHLRRGLIATFVPDYNDGTGLPAALAEGRRLVEEFGAEAQDPTCEGFTGFLSENMPTGPVSVLHFAGHAAPPGGADASSFEGLRMIDGWVSSSEIHSGVKLGVRDAPFVVINACSAGVSEQSLGVLGGWPASLAERGFGGVLAPVWAIQDEQASSVVLHQLDGLIKGQALGESMLNARVCYRNASATPYSYLCYGDVMARMV